MDKKLEKLIAEEGVTESSIYHQMAGRPWRQQKNEIQESKEDTRRRIRNSSVPEGAVLRRPKPQPTINDSEYKKVAVYARVSTQSEEQVSSIENQTKYYTEKVGEKPNWDLYKIYADEGKSGTSMKHRTEFKQMLQDAADQKFDTILCASVSRFARNVTDCIEQIKHLKTDNPRHPVGVYFETEGLYTLDPNSTMALFIHAMLADWESDNKSKRMILSYDQRICTGQYPVSDLLGYRHTKEGGLVIQEDEAVTVRYIFLAYLGGYTLNEIAETLTENERPTLNGRTEWNAAMVRAIMDNERRWGDLEARKSIVLSLDGFTDSEGNPLDFITDEAVDIAETVVNPPIIDEEIFEKARLEKQKRAEKLGRIWEPKDVPKTDYPVKFKAKPLVQKYDDPYKQAEYAYSLIESEV